MPDSISRLPDEIPGEVLAFLHPSRESAEDYAHRNRHAGHVCRVEHRAGVGYINVVDIRPVLGQARREFERSERRRAAS